jgi:short-subunit dehydrogenase
MLVDMSEQRTALVTGASSGFGAATAARLANIGFRVFGTSRSGRGGPGVEMLALDVDDDASVAACVAALFGRVDRVDVLVNNAGRAVVGACEEISAAEARALFETNVFGVMRVTAAILPSMRAAGRGAIVNVGSLSGHVGVPFHGVYAATKHALAGYSEALRFELEPFGIRVALIEPAAHRTTIQMGQPRRPLAVYDQGRARVEAVIRAQIENGADPERVVDAIVAAATRSRRFRHIVGRRAAVYAMHVLPERVGHALVRREFGQRSRS